MLVDLLLLVLIVVRGEAANGTVLEEERSASCWFFGLFRCGRPLELLLLERPETGKEHASNTVVAINATTILCLMMDGLVYY